MARLDEETSNQVLETLEEWSEHLEQSGIDLGGLEP